MPAKTDQAFPNDGVARQRKARRQQKQAQANTRVLFLAIVLFAVLFVTFVLALAGPKIITMFGWG